jgi:hypothetical protein
MQNLLPRIAISVFAIAIVGLREARPDLLDPTDLILLGVAILPWLSSILKSAELPGGLKVEFQELKDATAKVTASALAPPAKHAEDLTFLQVADTDPNLALVGLRIEIEKRLRTLAELHQIDSRAPLVRIFDELRRKEVLSDPALSGFQELVMFGNQAAHGAKVDADAARWAMAQGPRVLAVLDEAIDRN